MISASATRAAAVSAANSANVFELYGFTEGATPKQIADAQRVVEKRVAESEQLIDTFFAACTERGCDPYGSQVAWYKDPPNTAAIPIADLSQHTLASQSALRKVCAAAGFEVVAIRKDELSPYNSYGDTKIHGHRNGWFVYLRDPGYVSEKKAAAKRDRQRGFENFFRKLVGMKLREPEVLLLPAPPQVAGDGVLIDKPRDVFEKKAG